MEWFISYLEINNVPSVTAKHGFFSRVLPENNIPHADIHNSVYVYIDVAIANVPSVTAKHG
jgi:hypothetical protein